MPAHHLIIASDSSRRHQRTGSRRQRSYWGHLDVWSEQETASNAGGLGIALACGTAMAPPTSDNTSPSPSSPSADTKVAYLSEPRLG